MKRRKRVKRENKKEKKKERARGRETDGSCSRRVVVGRKKRNYCPEETRPKTD